MQVVTHMVIILPGPLGWTGLMIVGLLVVVVVLIAVVRHQRTSNASLRDGVTDLATEIVALENQLNNLVEDISQAREKLEVPTIGRQGSASESHASKPEAPSFWQDVRNRVSDLVSMLYRRIRPEAEIIVVQPSDLKPRLTDFQKTLISERNKISQLVESVAPRLKTDNAPKVNSESEEHAFANKDIESVYAREEVKQARVVKDESNWPADIIEDFGDEAFGGDKSLLQLYNRAVIDNEAREEFRERFKPIRIGIVNAVERRQNPTASPAPEFKEASDGDFFAVPMDGETRYSVVPRLGLTIGAVSYNAGALGEIFGNPSYDSTRAYSRYSVNKPAIFRHDNDRWIQVKPGHLNLGLPD